MIIDHLIIKSASLMYLFDFDGTLVGTDDWGGFLHNAKRCLKTCHFNPTELDIRWSILTSRPKIDKLFIKYICNHHKMKPSQIFTGPTFTWNFKSVEQEANYKLNVIKDILSSKIKVKYTDEKVNKILYIDNNDKITTHLNRNRENYPFLALNVVEFIKNNMYEILL